MHAPGQRELILRRCSEKDFASFKKIIIRCQTVCERECQVKNSDVRDAVEAIRPEWLMTDIRDLLVQTARYFVYLTIDELANDTEHFDFAPHKVEEISTFATIGRAVEAYSYISG